MVWISGRIKLRIYTPIFGEPQPHHTSKPLIKITTYQLSAKTLQQLSYETRNEITTSA